MSEDARVAYQLAGMLGPNATALSSSALGSDGEKLAYPTSLRNRGVAGPTRLYRQGLASREWRISSSAQSALLRLPEKSSAQIRAKRGKDEVGNGARQLPSGALCAPVTVVWGMKDGALSKEMSIDGAIQNGWLAHEKSQILWLQDVAHFVPTELTKVEWQESGFERVDGGGAGREKIGAKAMSAVVDWALEKEGTGESLEDYLRGYSGVGEVNVSKSTHVQSN